MPVSTFHSPQYLACGSTSYASETPGVRTRITSKILLRRNVQVLRPPAYACAAAVA